MAPKLSSKTQQTYSTILLVRRQASHREATTTSLSVQDIRRQLFRQHVFNPLQSALDLNAISRSQIKQKEGKEEGVKNWQDSQTVAMVCPGGSTGIALASTTLNPSTLPRSLPWESTTAFGSSARPILPEIFRSRASAYVHRWGECLP